MQSTAKTVSEYLEEVPAERKPALIQLRQLYRTTLTDFEDPFSTADHATPAMEKLK